GMPVWWRVKHHMRIPLVVVIGVEVAVVGSAGARHKRDVGRATLLAVLSALAVYLLGPLRSLGLCPRGDPAQMRQPPLAGGGGG
ncbi:arginine:ornithine antiporter, partial [Klebsiella pneumoniae]|nr:arginine:ornithine antiporter [Klebsiella pneumoniae]